jgi:putative two-component system response regulator
VTTPEPILCVDDDEQVRTLVMRVLESAGHRCDGAADVDDARALLAAAPYSVLLCDIGLPGSSGFELLEEVAQTLPDTAIVMITGERDPGVANAALQLGAYGYLTKPFGPSDLLIDVTNALHRRRLEADRRAAAAEALQRAYAGTLRRLSRAVEYHDGATGAHLERVGAHAATIGRALGLDRSTVELLRLAAPLHDIGKIAVPEHVLRKTGPLTVEERALMERHTEVGRDLLAGSGSELLELASTVAWTHHERWDGSGYPRALRADEIPLAGRIVAVADVFDALTSRRPYRPSIPASAAFAYLVGECGTSFDPEIVDAFAVSAQEEEDAA